MKHNYDKRDVTFDKRYTEPLKYEGKPLEITTYEKPLALPIHSPFEVRTNFRPGRSSDA